MKNYFVFFSLILLLTACNHTTYYIVRHAEKAAGNGNEAMMIKDPPLTEAGKVRAEALKEILKTRKIGYIFSTNTIRTRSTAEPVRAYFNLLTELYSPIPDSSFIARIKSLKKNTLIVGHSNTVDDIVNKLCRSIKIRADLMDNEFDNLYVVKKNKRKMNFINKKYGQPSQ